MNKRVQYVFRRREAARNSRPTIGRNVMLWGLDIHPDLSFRFPSRSRSPPPPRPPPTHPVRPTSALFAISAVKNISAPNFSANPFAVLAFALPGLRLLLFQIRLQRFTVANQLLFQLLDLFKLPSVNRFGDFTLYKKFAFGNFCRAFGFQLGDFLFLLRR